METCCQEPHEEPRRSSSKRRRSSSKCRFTSISPRRTQKKRIHVAGQHIVIQERVLHNGLYVSDQNIFGFQPFIACLLLLKQGMPTLTTLITKEILISNIYKKHITYFFKAWRPRSCQNLAEIFVFHVTKFHLRSRTAQAVPMVKVRKGNKGKESKPE